MIHGSRIRQIREARQLSQKDLALVIGQPQPFISQYESDARIPDAETGTLIADALGIPYRFLSTGPLSLPEGSLGLFRSLRSKVSSVEYTSARRKAELGIEAIFRLAEGHRLPLCRIEVVTNASAQEASMCARSMLHLPPDAPIGHLTRSLERAGVLVLHLAGLSSEIDGFSAWAPPPLDRPIIGLRKGLSPFRLRFTLAHELGHLVMGHQVFGRPAKDTEAEASNFAGQLLLPEEVMMEVFTTSIDVRRLAQIKGIWGVSMAAILYRAKQMGFVDDKGYRSLYEVMRRKGWLKREPGDDRTVAEVPKLFEELARLNGFQPDPTELVFRYDFALQDARDIFGGDDLLLANIKK